MPKKLLLIFIVFTYQSSLFSLGGTKAPTVQNYKVTFYETGNNSEFNKASGLTSFEHGFELENASSDVIWDATMPNNGDVILNDGTIHLEKDLVITGASTIFQTTGIIDGNNNDIVINSDIGTLPYIPPLTSDHYLSFQDTTIKMSYDLIAGSKMKFSGTCSILGGKNRIHLNNLASIEILAGSTLTLQNVEISGVEAQNIKCLDSSSTLILKDCKLILSDNYQFNSGNLIIDKLANICGPYNFTYQSNQSCTINSNSTLQFEQESTLNYNSTTPDKIAFTDQRSQLLFNSANLSTEQDLRLKDGALVFDNLSVFSAATGKTIYLGNNNSSENIKLTFSTTAELAVMDGILQNDNI